MCYPTKLQYRRPRYRWVREAVRRTLIAMARADGEYLDWREIYALMPEWPRDADGNQYGAFQFLRQHGFLEPLLPELCGRTNRWTLSDQAIRWLDWIGFDWSVRKLA